jgi:ubiquinone/menaquinone biosynthesis C-methylase UbiE
VAAAAASAAQQVIGIDFSAAMVDLATRVYPDLEFQGRRR